MNLKIGSRQNMLPKHCGSRAKVSMGHKSMGTKFGYEANVSSISSAIYAAAQHRVAPDGPTEAILPIGSSNKPFLMYSILLL